MSGTEGSRETVFTSLRSKSDIGYRPYRFSISRRLFDMLFPMRGIDGEVEPTNTTESESRGA